MRGKIILVIGLIFLAAVVRPAFATENPEETDLAFAKTSLKSGLYDAAAEKLESILRNYPNTPRIYEVHSLLGRCYYYQNRFTRALYEFEVVLNAPAGSDSQDEALYWSGEVYLKNGDYKKALELYQRIIDEFPSSFYLSHALYSKGWA